MVKVRLIWFKLIWSRGGWPRTLLGTREHPGFGSAPGGEEEEEDGQG